MYGDHCCKLGCEAWLISRSVDASKKSLVAAGILVFDFEFVIGALCEKERAGDSLKLPALKFLPAHNWDYGLTALL